MPTSRSFRSTLEFLAPRQVWISATGSTSTGFA